MTATCEPDFRPSPSQWRVDCKQNLEVSGADKRQLRTENNGTGSPKEGIGIGRGADKHSMEKEQHCADDAALLKGLTPRDGAKDLTEEHFHRELGSRLPQKDPRKVPFRPDPHVKYIVVEDDSEEGDCPAAACPSKQTKQQQQHQPGMSMGWETFLLQDHVKVLLVEDDDSTRHVMSALLRNCNYEVVAAANTVIAWDLLENPNNRFDLVLLDIIVPSSLSGVGLLLKIMECNSFKQIPVVVTSKHDSMDIVYQCLSKGAADFLVKPVRKNELKNLWQHVWRKRIRFANTGVGRTVNETRKTVAPNSPVDSDNNMSGSNNVNDCENAGGGLNMLGGSDNGSGNQTLQVQRNHCAGPMAGDGDEDCEAISENKSSDQTLGCDLEMATRRPAPGDIDNIQQETDGHQKMDLDDPTSAMQGKRGTMAEKYNDHQEGESSPSQTDGSAERRSQKAADLIGAIGCRQPPTSIEQPGESVNAQKSMDQRGTNSPKENNNLGSGCDCPPTLELTLMWHRNGGDKNVDSDEWCGLRQSGSSAFSRYSTMGFQQQEHPSGGTPSSRGCQTKGACGTQGLFCGGLAVNSSCSPQMGMPTDCTGSSKGSGEVSNPLETHTHNPHNGNGQDTSSSVMAPPVVHSGSKPTNREAAVVQGISKATLGPAPGSLYSEGVPPGYGPTMHPMYYIRPGPAWVLTPSPHNGADQGDTLDHPSAENQHVPIGHLVHPQNHLQPYYHSHHQHKAHYREHQHHSPSFQPPPLPRQQEEQPTNRALHHGSSAAMVLDKTIGQSGSGRGYRNGSGNESFSRNKNGSDGHNSHCDEPKGGANQDSTGNCGSACGSGVDNSTTVKNGFDGFDGFDGIMPACTPGDLMAWRKAALNKFRQKRKERCFAKKVRYHSRKKLAEQRPRVRGQFVRQLVQDLTDE